MASPIQLIVGLGNPGAQYAKNRHNAGIWFIDDLASRSHLAFKIESKFHAEVSRFPDDHRSWLLKPTTYMNDSGLAVVALARFYQIKPEAILVGHDELDHPPGIARLKQGGGHGGHNGLRDIAQRLQSNDFLRLRIGIGHPGHKDRVSPFVLSNPSATEKKAIDQAMDNALPIIERLLVDYDLEKAMRELHDRNE